MSFDAWPQGIWRWFFGSCVRLMDGGVVCGEELKGEK